MSSIIMPPPAPIKPQMKPTTTPQTSDCTSPLLGADALHGLLGGHDRPHDELDAQQQRHKHREAAHGRAEGTRLAT